MFGSWGGLQKAQLHGGRECFRCRVFVCPRSPASVVSQSLLHMALVFAAQLSSQGLARGWPEALPAIGRSGVCLCCLW